MELLEVGAVGSVYERRYPKPQRDLVFGHIIFPFHKGMFPRILCVFRNLLLFYIHKNVHKRLLCALQRVQIRYHS